VPDRISRPVASHSGQFAYPCQTKGPSATSRPRAALRGGDAALRVWPGRARPGCSPGGEPGCSRSKAGRTQRREDDRRACGGYHRARTAAYAGTRRNNTSSHRRRAGPAVAPSRCAALTSPACLARRSRAADRSRSSCRAFIRYSWTDITGSPVRTAAPGSGATRTRPAYSEGPTDRLIHQTAAQAYSRPRAQARIAVDSGVWLLARPPPDPSAT